jgi:hypothetical protein
MCGCMAGSGNPAVVIPPVPQTCSKTLAEYQAILVKVNTQLAKNLNYNIFTATVQSQINVYNSNCALFDTYITENIIPLLT